MGYKNFLRNIHWGKQLTFLRLWDKQKRLGLLKYINTQEGTKIYGTKIQISEKWLLLMPLGMEHGSFGPETQNLVLVFEEGTTRLFGIISDI